MHGATATLMDQHALPKFKGDSLEKRLDTQHGHMYLEVGTVKFCINACILKSHHAFTFLFTLSNYLMVLNLKHVLLTDFGCNCSQMAVALWHAGL